MSESEMKRRSGDSAGPIGEAMRRRYREFYDADHGNGFSWPAIRDVLLPTLLDIADELDALRKERGKPKTCGRPESMYAIQGRGYAD